VSWVLNDGGAWENSLPKPQGAVRVIVYSEHLTVEVGNDFSIDVETKKKKKA